MAHFIKKIVDRTRSRSKSPVKYHRNDYEQWKEMQHQQYSSHYGSSMRTYDYFVHPTYDQQFQNFHASISFCLNGNSANYYSYSPDFQSGKDGFTNPMDILSLHSPTSLTTPPSPCLKLLEGHLWDAHPVQRSPHSTASHHSDFIHPNNELIIPIPSSPIHSDIMDKQNETFDSSSSPANNRSNTSIPSAKQKELDVKKKHITRPRSISPQKTPQTSFDETSKKSRSKSPVKRFPQILETLDYLSPQCQLGGCSATLIVQDTKFLVCKHQLSHVSDYFRALFLANKSIPKSGAYHNSCNEFAIVVSSFRHPPPAIQFKWFLESTIQSSIFSDITEVEIADDKLETCMRLSKRFRAKSLEAKCARYIQDNVVGKTPMVALCWLNWVLKHKFDQTTYDACLPCVATASVRCLEEHRNLISERLLADLLAAKLRTLYDQAVTVFQTIHSMDHFYVDVPKCPNCGRQREQGKVRIQASPCRKMLGCERCLREYSCNLSGKDHKDLQACYQCKHGLVPLNDHTADCQCQIPLLASHLKGLQPHFLSLISHH